VRGWQQGRGAYSRRSSAPEPHGNHTGSQWVDEYLYRTKGGRWVRNHDAHRQMGGPDTYEFYDDEQARDWLLRSECNDEAVARFFGEVEEERGPGRPEVGGAVHVRLGALLANVDAYAEAEQCPRAEAIRRLVLNGLRNPAAPAPRSGERQAIDAGAPYPYMVRES